MWWTLSCAPPVPEAVGPWPRPPSQTVETTSTGPSAPGTNPLPPPEPGLAVETVPPAVEIAQACDFSNPPAPRDVALGTAPAGARNVLVVVLDDVGVDQFARFGADLAPATPVLDGLADQGTILLSTYVSPLCSPTRAELLTGRYNHHNGVGDALNPNGPVGLPCTETTLAEALDAAGWATSAIGKWHLSVFAENAGAAPLVHGFGWFRGSVANLGVAGSISGAPMDHYRWERWANGAMEWVDLYSTTAVVDDAIKRIGVLPEPWFAYVAFQAAHAPYQGPPAELIDVDTGQGPPNDVEAYASSITALDAEFGRLLDTVDLGSTFVWVIGDNGSPAEIVGAPAKATPYEPGVHVPLWVAGPGVQVGASIDGFAQAVDLMPTVLDLLDVHIVSDFDGVSLAGPLIDGTPSPRSYAFSGIFEPVGGAPPLTREYRMVRDARFKLMRELHVENGVDEWYLFDLLGAGEGVDLLDGPLDLDAAEAHGRLLAAYGSITAP